MIQVKKRGSIEMFALEDSDIVAWNDTKFEKRKTLEEVYPFELITKNFHCAVHREKDGLHERRATNKRRKDAERTLLYCKHCQYIHRSRNWSKARLIAFCNTRRLPRSRVYLCSCATCTRVKYIPACPASLFSTFVGMPRSTHPHC